MPSYSQFLSAAQRGWVGERGAHFKNEIELQSLFFAGHFGREFLTTDGRKVTIRQFGEWNHGPGPDFLNCAIYLAGQLLTGPIELDTKPSDWESHGHATNSEFDEVVLHLSIESSSRTTFIRTSEHREVPQVRIPSERLDTLFPPPLSQAPVTRGRCSFPLSQMAPNRVEDLIKKAALHRAQLKANHFLCVRETHGYAQALWQALANALGYHQNQLAMTLLAQRAPIAQLRNLPPLDRSAYLFGLAGFLAPDLPKSAPEESHQWLSELWSSWWKNRPHPDPRSLPWRLAGVRPSNHPQRRIAALASLLRSWPTVEKLSRESPPAFLKKIMESDDPFWNYHYTLTSKPSTRPIALFGKQRGQDFLANIIYPLQLAEDAHTHWPSYAKLAGTAPSERVKRAAYRLFGDRPEKASFLKKAWQQQGLLQIYQDFCLQDHSDCEQCPFPEQLLTW